MMTTIFPSRLELVLALVFSILATLYLVARQPKRYTLVYHYQFRE